MPCYQNSLQGAELQPSPMEEFDARNLPVGPFGRDRAGTRDGRIPRRIFAGQPQFRIPPGLIQVHEKPTAVAKKINATRIAPRPEAGAQSNRANAHWRAHCKHNNRT